MPANKIFYCLLFCLGAAFSAGAQCPYNIDFETGSFQNWTCYVGTTSAGGGRNTIALGPVSAPMPDRHTMLPRSSEVDPYGGFPVNCPNGSGHSIRLGNDQGGGEAEGISYEFTIPAGQDVFSLIYHYAVVFQDPNHQEYEQPRMEVEIMNMTDNVRIDCSSFTFIPYGNILPGFYESPNLSGGTPVWCKDWSAVTINLNGHAGKTIRLFFKTADCTFRRHFGYAYIDVNSECSDEFVGATYCPDDTAVNIVGPYGYQNYTWYNNNFSQVLGHQQTIRFNPPPPTGTTIAVEIEPYSGYGCRDTLFARLLNTLDVAAEAGRDTFYCSDPVPIGANPKQGFVYSWSPATGLSDPNIANPYASPSVTTTYVLTSRHDGGGCVDTDTVTVGSAGIDNSIDVAGKLMYCVGSGDSTILRAKPNDSIQWYKDGVAIRGATGTELRVTQSGVYYAVVFSDVGCKKETARQTVLIETARPALRYPLEYAVIDLPRVLQARQFGTSALWKPANFLNSASSYKPTFQGNTDQEYTIEIRTISGCMTVDTQLVKAVKDIAIYVPSAFTPNGDGLNDVLKPVLMGIQELRYFRVFNRWGQLIFETKEDKRGWDGTVRGARQSTQVVVWTVEGVGINGKVYQQKGTAVLIR